MKLFLEVLVWNPIAVNINISGFFPPKKILGHEHINHATGQIILSFNTVWLKKLLVPNSKGALTLEPTN